MPGIRYIVLSWLACCASAWGIEVGQSAPDFILSSGQRSVKLSDFKGKAVYLDFWASWCGPCKQSFPWMDTMQSRYRDQGLQVLAVNVDKKADAAQTFLVQHPVRFEVVFDAAGQVAQSYAIKSMPTSVLIGPDGKVRMVHGGFRDDQRGQLEEQIKTALPATK